MIVRYRMQGSGNFKYQAHTQWRVQDVLHEHPLSLKAHCVSAYIYLL